MQLTVNDRSAMNYTPTTINDLLAQLGESFPYFPLDQLIEEHPGVMVTRERLADLIDALAGDPDAYDNLPRQWQQLTN